MHSSNLPSHNKYLKPGLAIVLGILLHATPAGPVRGNHSLDYATAGFNAIGIHDGLSHNTVICIHQDHLGLIWLGTRDGLNLYDGYSFTVFRHNPFDPYSISHNHISSIATDAEGRLWVGTRGGGLNLLDRETGHFHRILHEPGKENSLSDNTVKGLAVDSGGDLWVGTDRGLNLIRLQQDGHKVSVDTLHVERLVNVRDGISLEKARIHGLFVDSHNGLWVDTGRHIMHMDLSGPMTGFEVVETFTGSRPASSLNPVNDPVQGGRKFVEDAGGELWLLGNSGLYRFDRGKGRFLEVPLHDASFRFGEIKAAAAFNHQNRQEIWAGTARGLLVIDTETGAHQVLPQPGDDGHALSRGNYISMMVDRSGSIWLGSDGSGIMLYDPYSNKFNYPAERGRRLSGREFSTRQLSVRAFHIIPGQEGILWVGGREGLFAIDRDAGVVREIGLTAEGRGEELRINAIDSDPQGRLWLGTSLGLGSYEPGSGRFALYPTGLQDGDETGEPRVSAVHVSGNQIWVMTPNTIALFDRQRGGFIHTRYNNHVLNRFTEDVFPAFYEDPGGDFWFGTGSGLHRYERETGRITSYRNDSGNPFSLPFNDVRAIVPDPTKPRILWLATGGGGLARFDTVDEQFISFTEADGLPGNMLSGLLACPKGELWISSRRGLSRFSPGEGGFTNYTHKDGLQNNEFNSGAFYMSPDAEMFFGGRQGYNSFFPHMVVQKNHRPPVMITGFRLLGDKDGREQLPHIFPQEEIRLAHNQNHFAVEFAALDFASPENNRYSYSLTRQGENWISLGTNRSIIITDLKPGRWILRVRGTNNDGVWSDQEAVVDIVVARPWWGHGLARVFYVLLFSAAMLLVRHYELSRIRLKNMNRLSALETFKLKEVDAMKSRFFANISHELRTPLTLIKGPIEDMIDEYPDHDEKRARLLNMHHHTGRLLALIGQLLDLSKLESGLFKIQASGGDINEVLRRVFMSFSSLAGHKKIRMSYVDDPSLKDPGLLGRFYYDPDVMEKILANLLSNALKFTPDGGRVTLTACFDEKQGSRGVFELVVKDTGIGIPREKLPLIYDRFFQVNESAERAHQGSGVGLAYVKELVELHHGRIWVMSKQGVGTVFRLQLPLGHEHFEPGQLVQLPAWHAGNEQTGSQDALNYGRAGLVAAREAKAWDRPIVLVVEDHEDVRAYIADALSVAFAVMEAPDGKTGLELAREHIPDLIISDIMMPGMDGFAFCRQIKAGELTGHIPVVLLTARAEDTDKMEGLETGADEYLTKPFNRKELSLRVRNIIDGRRKLLKRHGLKGPFNLDGPHLRPGDRLFLQKLLTLVEQNIDNDGFSVEDLARGSAMSLSQLHRKLKALLGQSANQFIRAVRMQRARELLEKNAGNVAEIAYMVGYADPGYFTKSFRAFFGQLPSEVKNSRHEKK